MGGQGGLREKRRNKIQYERLPVLQLGAHLKRGRRRGRGGGERERQQQHQMDEHETQLGPELATRHCLGWSVAVL